MSVFTVSRYAGSLEVAWARAVAAALRHWSWTPALAAIVLIGTYEAHLALEPPGAAIRYHLVRAGADVANLGWSTPSARVQGVVLRDFPGYQASVDATRFPSYVTVTLHDLGDADCRSAHRIAERIQGLVVVAMERPDAACARSTSLSWRIMP